MKRLLLILALALAPSLAWAQNPMCPTRPIGDNTNACASTAFVQAALGGIGATKVTQYLNPGSGSHTVTSGTTMMQIIIVAGGGGGSGNTGSNRIPYALYGGRGGDSSFLVSAGVAATFSGTTVTVVGHTLANSQPIYFTNSGGALPSPLVANTRYFVVNGSQSGNDFEIAAIPYTPPGVVVQTPITFTGGSGTNFMAAYFYTAQGGGGGGIIGDQGTPQGSINCELVNNPQAGYQTSYAMQGSAGNNIYGNNIASGMGGGSMFGGAGASQQLDNGNAGNNKQGGGGSGAGATPTSAGGGGGAGGTVCQIWQKPTTASYEYYVGEAGTAGSQGADTATVTIASPGVVTIANHGFGVNTPITFTTTGTLPTGLLVGTTYYVYGPSLTINTFQLTATPSLGANGTPINTSGSQSGVHTVHSGYAGGIGGTGAVIVIEYFN